jgi:hypothetical protein
VDVGDALPVVGMNVGQEPFVGRVERLRFVTVDAVQLVRPLVRVGGDVPVVVAHLRQPLRVVDAGLEVGEPLLGDGPGDCSVDDVDAPIERRAVLRRLCGPRDDEHARVARQPVHTDLRHAGLGPATWRGQVRDADGSR